MPHIRRPANLIQGQPKECPFCGSKNIFRIVCITQDINKCEDCRAQGPVRNVTWNDRPKETKYEAILRGIQEKIQAKKAAKATAEFGVDEHEISEK